MGGRVRKERLQLHLWNFNICVEKVNAKCWLAEITLVMCLQLARASTCFLMFVYIRTQIISPLHWLAEIWQLSRRGNWRPNSNSREIVASSPSFSRPTAWVPRRACSQATKTLISTQIGGFHAIINLGRHKTTMVKWTNAGGQTKRANERSFVNRPPAWRQWRNVKTTYKQFATLHI